MYVVVLFIKKLLLIQPHIAIETILAKKGKKCPKKSPPSPQLVLLLTSLGQRKPLKEEPVMMVRQLVGSFL